MPARVVRLLVWWVAIYAIVGAVAARHIPRLLELKYRGIPTTGLIASRDSSDTLKYVFVAAGTNYTGYAHPGIAHVPISDIADPIYLTYLPWNPEVNVAGDINDLLAAEYQTCTILVPWTAVAAVFMFLWNMFSPLRRRGLGPRVQKRIPPRAEALLVMTPQIQKPHSSKSGLSGAPKPNY